MTRRRLDEVDRAIVERLSRDARISNGHIAGELGASLAYIWIEVERSGQARAVAASLAKVPELGFVGVMLGRSDILAITMVRNAEHLAEFVHQRISGIEGVRRTESTLGVNFVKHDYRMARIVS